MAASGIGELMFIAGTMDQYIYMDILKNNFLRSAQKLGLQDDYYFEQDKHPKHIANNVRH